MSLLFRRKALVQVGTLRFEYDSSANSLDFDFSIEKNVGGNPNKGEIKIYNLNAKHRAELAKEKKFPVIVSAGYDDHITMIFRGDIQRVNTSYDGSTYISEVAATDGGNAHRYARASLAFPKGTAVGDVAKAIGNSLAKYGIGLGNLADFASTFSLEGVGSTQFSGGVSVSGQASRELRKIVESTGHEFSIQDGNIQITKRGVALGRKALFLSAASGLVSAPVKDAKGITTAKTFIIPDLLPGRQVEFKSSANTTGQFRVIGCKYTGSTFTDDWFCEFTCKEI